MITLGLLIAAAAPTVVEVPDPGSSVVLVQTYVAAGKLGDRDTAAWRVIGETLFEGTEDFTRDRILAFGSQAGVAPKVVTMPDFMRIQFVAPRGGLDVASQLLESVLRQATLRDAPIIEAIERLERDDLDSWRSALNSVEPAWKKVRPVDVRNLYARTFRPERMTFVFGGAITAGQGHAQTAKRFPDTGWPRVPRFVPDGPIKPRAYHPNPLTTFELRGRVFGPTDGEAAARIVAVFALGVGKGSAMHKALRDEQGFSYRQESVLYPTSIGWQPRLLAVHRVREGDAEALGSVRDALLKQVSAWAEPDLLRARNMAQSALAGTVPFSAFWLDDSGPMSGNLEDRCAWRGFLAMCGAGEKSESALGTSLALVSLEQMRAAAQEMLSSANGSVILGRR